MMKPTKVFWTRNMTVFDTDYVKTGCLLTTDGSGNHLVQPEGLPDYKIPPPTMLDPLHNLQFPQGRGCESKDDDDESLQYVGSDEEENDMLVEERSMDDRNIFAIFDL